MKSTQWNLKKIRGALLAAVATLWLLPANGRSQVSPPDLSVCENQSCDTLPESYCSSGFSVVLSSYVPGSDSNSGTATFTYSVCSPAEGLCDSGPALGNSCLDDSQCSKLCKNGACQGNHEFACSSDADCAGTCDRDCAVDEFRALSHFDVGLPDLGLSCLSENNEINVTCSSGTPSFGQDGACGGFFSAKCDAPNLSPGACLTMSISIAGEQSGIGLGATILIDKEAQTCEAQCGFGPSCEPCDSNAGEQCLTRTIGFWGTHPWITNNYDPVLVCGKTLGCDDLSSDSSACSAGSCSSVMEGLCSVPGQELPGNQAYVSMVRQMTAAQLNLNATASLSEGGFCSSWSSNGKTIQEWLAYCESLCAADKATISASGCIEALDEFNNSQDTGFDQVPAPFDRPSVNDQGQVAGADPTQCNLAQGNNKKAKLVIGKNIPGKNCQ